MKRITRRRLLRFSVDFWAETFSRRMEVCVRERIHWRWRFIGTCTCLRVSLARRSFARLFGKRVFSRSSCHNHKQAWEAFQRIDTSLLRAACWTMASGMRLERHVKAQCGETCKVDWCCEILSEVGVPCGLRFRSKKAWRCHQLRSRLHGHGLQTSIFASDVITNSCPWCRSTFATTLIARKHAVAAMLSGHCRVDAGAFPWPISPLQSLLCRLCQNGDSYTSIDDFYDHAVAVHLPKPSLVSLLFVTALHHACGTRGTPRDTSCEGSDHGRGGEETTTNT